ncbi:MAG: hypothetical protein U9N63_03555 [Pseudomonadota bacterium]|nr:hypothetical protein [Pseudomonadota bacterium]
MSRFILLLSLVFLTVSCAGDPEPVSAPTSLKAPYTLDKVAAKPLPEQYIAPILAMDQRVTEVLFYVNHRQQRFPSGQVRVTFNLYNANPEQDEWVDWKMVYYDINNDRIEETDWETTLFARQIIKTIKSNSIRPDVTNYSVIVKTSPRTDLTKTKKLGYVREMEEKKGAEELAEREAEAREMMAGQGAGQQPGAMGGQANPAAAGINNAGNTIGAIGNTFQQATQATQAAAGFQQTIKAIQLLK